MTLKDFLNLIVLIAIGPIMSFSAFCQTSSVTEDPWFTANIVRKEGTIRPTEILEWKKDPNETPSDWLKINNKNFTASYPKCIEVNGTGELFDHPENSNWVGFSARKCSGFENKSTGAGGLGVSYKPHKGMLKVKSELEPTFMVQDINLNGHSARMFVVGHPVGEKPKENIQLSWHIYADCKEKTIYFVTSSEPGKPTVDLIEKKNYQFPEFFKKIVETFQCK